MPSRRTLTEGAERPAPRRSERLRRQREAALMVANPETQTNSSSSSSIAVQSHAISSPERPMLRPRLWAGLDLAGIRRAAEDVINAARSDAARRLRLPLGRSGGHRSTPSEDGENDVPSTIDGRASSENGVSNYTLVLPEGARPSPVQVTVLDGWLQPNFRTSSTGVRSPTMMRRLKRELLDFQKDAPEGCAVEVVGDNMYHWRGSILGPPETPYTGGQFHLDLQFGRNYPFTPPNIFFLTKIYHCNISSNGDICLDILSSAWSPALTVAKVLLSIRSLIADPNPDDPLQPTIANLYKRHRTQHDKMASSWTAKYAKPGQEPQIPECESE